MKMTGAEAMVRSLELAGVPVVFGYPGAAIAPFYDSLSRSSAIRHILTRSEQGAGHAANGWARLSGIPGVCVATSGPGATNLFTAIATAYSDSIPIVAITGQVATHQLGRDIFQEVDTTGAVEPFTKYARLVQSPAELGQAFREAFHIASTGRKGPVLLDIPLDVQQATVDFHWPESVNIRGYKPPFEGHPLQIRRVAEAISSAERPLVCCGGGVLLSGAQQQVQALCEQAGLPAVSTLMGIGAFPPSHPLYYGMLGQMGTAAANAAVRESDLLVLIGARVGDRAITHPSRLEEHATIVHIDIDTAEIGKNLGTTIPLVGDAARVLDQLLQRRPSGNYASWVSHLNKLRGEVTAPKPSPSRKGVDPAALTRAISEGLKDDGVYVADVGQNQMWSARNFAGNGRFLTTGGMGTMGYSIPAAVGAKVANPSCEVVAVCGDGAFQMSMNELATIRQHRIPVKVVVLRNDRLGLVREIQQTSYGGNEFAVELSGGPDLSAIAAAYGIPFARLEDSEGIASAVDALFAENGPYLLECTVDPEEVSVP